MTELLAEQIGREAINEINAERWGGSGEIPVNLQTKTYKDTHEIEIKGNKYHLEIGIVIEIEQVDIESKKHKPYITVAIVENETKEILNSCKTYTLASSHIVALMILYLYKEYAKITK